MTSAQRRLLDAASSRLTEIMTELLDDLRDAIACDDESSVLDECERYGIEDERVAEARKLLAQIYGSEVAND